MNEGNKILVHVFSPVFGETACCTWEMPKEKAHEMVKTLEKNAGTKLSTFGMMIAFRGWR